ncbi:ankyrin repeat-containing domain protein [Pelagophyceae sp. CCMP2097]|nr:ankyrin repeat-containing domain protein [Pelagophyceae sp. CCMP2097]
MAREGGLRHLRVDGDFVHAACFHTLPIYPLGSQERLKSKDLGPTLRAAAARGDVAVVDRLLREGGVDPNSASVDFGETALHLAAANGHLRVCEVLLDDGRVFADARDRDRRTAAHAAARNGVEAVVRLLAGHANAVSDLRLRDAFGETPGDVARAGGYADVARALDGLAEDVPNQRVKHWGAKERDRMLFAASRTSTLMGRKQVAAETAFGFAAEAPLPATDDWTQDGVFLEVAAAGHDMSARICARVAADLVVDSILTARFETERHPDPDDEAAPPGAAPLEPTAAHEAPGQSVSAPELRRPALATPAARRR